MTPEKKHFVGMIVNIKKQKKRKRKMNELLEKELENKEDMDNDAGFITDELVEIGTDAPQEATDPIGEQGTEQNAGETNNLLPENVTEAPRNSEEMHLKHISKWPDAVKVYLKVSDDEGEVLGSKVLERRARNFCDQYAGLKDDIKDPQKVIEEAVDLATRYTLQINMVESGLAGTITKYRIRQGMLFNIMKGLVKKTKGPKWIIWFHQNFDPREFRSVQDYMRLAGVPNIIRYAVFGKERLLQTLRQLSEDDKKRDDPIGAFIERNGIHFNPTEETDAQELKIETDIALSYQRLLGAGIDNIPKEMVDAFVRGGNEIEPTHLRELEFAKNAGVDTIERFKEIMATDGKPEPLMTPDRKAEGFKKTTDRFLKAMESAISDAEYLQQVNAEVIAALKEKLDQLEKLFSTAN